jgi:phage shock protein PspC (stress-responsive transcriptional regulator)
MEYSVFIGILSAFQLNWQEWIFLIVILFFLFSGVSTYISLNRSKLTKNDTKNKKKILILVSIFFCSFILFGLIGLILFTLIHFIILSFISDYRLGEK